MPPFLQPDERVQLTQMLAGLPEFGDAQDCRTLLEQAGLHRFLPTLNLSGAPRDVAGRVVGVLESYGALPERPDTHALGALLAYLLARPDLPADHQRSAARLVARYDLVRTPGYVDKLVVTYGVSAGTVAIEWQIGPETPAPAISDHPSSTFDQRSQQVQHQTNVAGDLVQYITVVQGSGAGARTVQIDRRTAEIDYLNDLIRRFEYWAEKFTPLAGIAEVQAAAAAGPTLDLPTLFMPTGFEKLTEHGYGPQREVKRVPVDDLREAVRTYRRLVLLGEPGSGKTTTLWRLTYDLAQEAMADAAAPLPLLAPLGAYTGPEPALEFAQGHFGDLGPHLPAYLRAGRTVLLLDGLNEMPQRERKARVGRVQALLDRFAATPALVTCRALDYASGDAAPLKLEKLEVKPLDPPRQRAYLHRYLGEADGERLFWQLTGDAVAELWRVWQAAAGTWEQFWTAEKIPEAVRRRTSGGQDRLWAELRRGGLPPLLALGVNPYMLVMLAQVYTAGHGALPQNRGRLFAAFVDTLLAREEERCDKDSWPGAQPLRQALARLAYAMQSAGERGTAVERAWALGQLGNGCDPEQILILAAGATLLDLAGEQVRFVHQLIQEYFAAVAWRGHWEAGAKLAKRWPDGWLNTTGWEETAILLAGILPTDASQGMAAFVDDLLAANPPLAARCLAESGQTPADPHCIERVQARLVAIVTGGDHGGRRRGSSIRWPFFVRRIFTGNADDVQRRARAGEALNLVGDPRPGVGLRPDGLPDIDWVAVPQFDPTTGRREFVYQDETHPGLPTFWIGRFPVTYCQFQTFVDAADGWADPAWWQGLAMEEGERSQPYEQSFPFWNHPRERVTWVQAVAFGRWLAHRAASAPDLLPAALRGVAGWRISLPTEWQWEKAARGHDGRRYPWGGDTYETGRANIDETFENVGPHDLQKTSAVGMYPHGASPYGVQDLSGNVWEWCLNEYDNPARIQEGGDARRVVRGGSWLYGPLYAAAVARFDLWDLRNDFVGCRVVVWVPSLFPSEL